MQDTTIHNPDRFMVDLRQILSQGKKRIGLLIGAGAPVSVRVDGDGKLDDAGAPLIPDVARLTDAVVDGLEDADRAVIDNLRPELGDNPNIETILTRVRRLSQAIGAAEVHGLNGEAYEKLAERICEKLGRLLRRSYLTSPTHLPNLFLGSVGRIEITRSRYSRRTMIFS